MNREPSQIESLLKFAGERDQPSSEALERARAAARLHWRRALDAQPAPARRSIGKRPILGWALAAGVSALAAIYWFRAMPAPGIEVARIAALQGDVHVDSGDRLVAGTVLRAGDVLEAGDGRVALAVGDALSLRLDRGTRLKFVRPGEVALITGAVYVDSGGLNAHTALRIGTPAGVVRHWGTQYQVRVRGDLTRVRVREGRVVFTIQDGAADLAAGDVAEASGGPVRILHGEPTHGADWEWAAATAPSFDIENRPLSEFLTWLAREHGWQLRFADAGTQSRAQSIRLHGSMAGLGVDGMLERASLVTGVPLSARDGELWVGASR